MSDIFDPDLASAIPLLQVRNLQIDLRTAQGARRIVDNVSFSIAQGETLGVVGESGSGKSMTAFAILGVLPAAIRISGGEVLWNGANLTASSELARRRIAGKEIAMVLQDPMSNLNPVLTCGEQVAEVLRQHQGATRRAAEADAIAMLDLVGLPDPRRAAQQYPHQLSGGMRQRVMIAAAIACQPKLLIADEPTSALDVTVQAQILERIDQLKSQFNMAVLLISHDMGVVAEHSQRVAVMYAGRIVEEGDGDAFFARPEHPYSRGLLASSPDIDDESGAPLQPIPGVAPHLIDLRAGCGFATRCSHASDICRQNSPPERARKSGGTLRCWHADA